MSLQLEIVLGFMTIPTEAIWEMLRSSHPVLFAQGKTLMLCGDPVPAEKMDVAIRNRNLPHFEIEFEEGSLDYSPVGISDLDLIFIKGCVFNPDDAWAWANPFALNKDFRTARIYDKEYEYWQNAHDIIQYKTTGRSYAGIPMKSNGLPFPLEQQIIDTSQNPGRRVLRDGYVEAVGATMWLGQPFWPLTGARINEVKNRTWIQAQELEYGVLRVQAADAAFITAEGEEGYLQDRFRWLLFPNSQAS